MAEIANLKDFLRTLKLGRVHLGQHAGAVTAILGEPDCVGGDSRKHRWPPIWKYGDIELLFDYRTRQVNMVVITFWEQKRPIGGASIQLDPWIIKGGLQLDELIHQLDKEGIDYCEVEPINPGTRQLLVNSAITMIFDNVPEENNDPDEWMNFSGLCKLCLYANLDEQDCANAENTTIGDSQTRKRKL
jgi:hypothetical protein